MEEINQEQITPQEFSQKVKSKYPEYKDIDDVILAKKMVEKYPEYANQVSFEVKKKDNLESSGATPQEVSPTPITPRKSLLGTESQKKQSAWDTSVGKSKDVTLGGFKVNKPIVGVAKPKTPKVQPIPSVDFNKMNVDQLIDLDKGNEVTYLAPSANTAFAGGVSKTKMSPQLRPQFDNFIKENYSTALQKIKPYVLKKEDLNSIEDDYEEAKNGGGFFEGVKTGLTGIKDYLGWGEQEKTGKLDFKKNPLDDLRKEVRDEAIHNGETLLPGQVEYRVKQKFIENRTKEVNQTKMNSAKENLTPAEQYSIGLHKAEQASHLSKENKEKTKNYYETLSNSKSLLDDKEQLVKEYNEMKANKTPIPQEYIDRYKDNEQNIALNLGLAKTYKAEINKNQKDIGTFEQEAAAYTSENNELLDITKRIQSYGYSFMGGVHEFAAKYIDKPLYEFGKANLVNPGEYLTNLEETDRNYSEEYAKKAQDIKEGKEGIVEGVRLGGTAKTLSLNSVNDYANELVAIVGDNIGMTAVLLAGGTPGLVATTIESTGNKVKEIRNENEEFKKAREEAIKNKEGNFEFNGEKYNTKEYANKDLHSEVASYLVPAAWGATMVLPMARQLKFLQGEARIAAAIEKQSPEYIQKTLMQKSKDWTKQYIGHSLGLARDLKIMSLAQAGLDDSLGKKVDYFQVATDLKGVRDAFILHGMNAGFAHALGQTARPYMTNKEAKVIDDGARLIFNLNNRLMYEQLTPESKVLVKKQLDRLTAESKVYIDNVIDRMSNMSDADYSKVIDLAKKSSDLRQEATDVQNSEFSAKDKQLALDKIKADYLENEKNLRGVKENYVPKKDGFFALPDREQNKLKEEAGKKLIADAKARGEKEFAFSDRDITMEASKLYDFKNLPKEEVVTPTEEEVVTPTEQSKAKDIVDEGVDFHKSYRSIDEVPEFLKPLAVKSSFGEEKSSRFGKKQKVQMYNVLATAEEVQRAYNDFYKAKEVPKEYTDFEEVKQQEDFRLSFNDTPEVTAEKIRKSKEAEVKLTEEVNKPKGTEDVISEPIELEVKPKEEKIAFHGTNKKFDKFSDDTSGTSTDAGWFGKGIYFHSDSNRGGYSEGENGRVIKAKLNIDNPISLPTERSGEFLYDIIGEKAGLDKSFREESAQNIIREIGSEKFTEIAKELGYDGVEVNYSEGTKETVVFDANKIDIIKEPTPAKTRKVSKEKLIEEVKPTEEVKTIGENPRTSIDVVDDYNAMTKQYREKGKEITLDDNITIEEHKALKKELLENLKKAQEIKNKPSEAEVKVETKEKEKKVSLPTEAVDKMKELLKDEKQQKAILKKLIAEGRIRKIC